jgi:hypothetical protein
VSLYFKVLLNLQSYINKITICIIQKLRVRILCSFNVVTNDDLTKSLIQLTNDSRKNRNRREDTLSEEDTTIYGVKAAKAIERSGVAKEILIL